MADNWVRDFKNTLFTHIKYQTEKAYKSKYKSLKVTRDKESNVTNFPTVYIQYLSGREVGQDLTGDTLNGFQCDMQIDVTSSKTQEYVVAEDICYTLIDILKKKWNFRVTTFPIEVNNSGDTHTVTFRVSRIVGFNDSLFK
ncbi:MAG: hypothetical protein KBT03_01440 [Bacteroidales bacterium]|nr:hypothetical protein [Candidatus Scybalousia scybalohippi]